MQLSKRLIVFIIGLIIFSGASIWLGLKPQDDEGQTPPRVVDRQSQILYGEYLARVGNCGGCHTGRGGAAFAGGKPIQTPFGVVYSSNLTPDPESGLGQWSANDFWRAMHHGQSRDGRLLTPAFPYTNMTRVSREDSDALFAWLQTLPAVTQAQLPASLRFPFNTQAALVVWRALYFRSGVLAPDPEQSPLWNRGAYLVRGLGHCEACHAPRNALGALGTNRLWTSLIGRHETSGAAAEELTGGWLPMQSWYAPSLQSNREAGLADWSTEEVMTLLREGRNDRASAIGPMAQVVLNSTQWLSDDDLLAMATFLRALPAAQSPHESMGPLQPLGQAAQSLGQTLYEKHCAECHGANGAGQSGRYPALAGNRAVTLAVPANVIRIVMHGGYAPGTSANPRPYGMAPYAPFLNDAEIAAVVSYIRNAWGNRASSVDSIATGRHRRLALE
jgi:mono/diheme cytochrome c family protein